MKEADILLIEDNSADADLTIRALNKKNANLNIMHFEDGAEALDYIFFEGIYRGTTRESCLKLILMDLQLPKINGQVVLNRIKLNKETKMIPTVILTSSNLHKDVIECYQLGANGYMVKPLDFEDYIQQISKAVDFWIDINYYVPFY
jgi:CheY-like chemotaxis protein